MLSKLNLESTTRPTVSKTTKPIVRSKAYLSAGWKNNISDITINKKSMSFSEAIRVSSASKRKLTYHAPNTALSGVAAIKTVPVEGMDYYLGLDLTHRRQFNKVSASYQPPKSTLVLPDEMRGLSTLFASYGLNQLQKSKVSVAGTEKYDTAPTGIHHYLERLFSLYLYVHSRAGDFANVTMNWNDGRIANAQGGVRPNTGNQANAIEAWCDADNDTAPILLKLPLDFNDRDFTVNTWHVLNNIHRAGLGIAPVWGGFTSFGAPYSAVTPLQFFAKSNGTAVPGAVFGANATIGANLVEFNKAMLQAMGVISRFIVSDSVFWNAYAGAICRTTILRGVQTVAAHRVSKTFVHWAPAVLMLQHAHSFVLSNKLIRTGTLADNDFVTAGYPLNTIDPVLGNGARAGTNRGDIRFRAIGTLNGAQKRFLALLKIVFNAARTEQFNELAYDWALGTLSNDDLNYFLGCLLTRGGLTGLIRRVADNLTFIPANIVGWRANTCIAGGYLNSCFNLPLLNYYTDAEVPVSQYLSTFANLKGLATFTAKCTFNEINMVRFGGDLFQLRNILIMQIRAGVDMCAKMVGFTAHATNVVSKPLPRGAVMPPKIKKHLLYDNKGMPWSDVVDLKFSMLVEACKNFVSHFSLAKFDCMDDVVCVDGGAIVADYDSERMDTLVLAVVPSYIIGGLTADLQVPFGIPNPQYLSPLLAERDYDYDSMLSDDEISRAEFLQAIELTLIVGGNYVETSYAVTIGSTGKLNDTVVVMKHDLNKISDGAPLNPWYSVAPAELHSVPFHTQVSMEQGEGFKTVAAAWVRTTIFADNGDEVVLQQENAVPNTFGQNINFRYLARMVFPGVMVDEVFEDIDDYLAAGLVSWPKLRFIEALTADNLVQLRARAVELEKVVDGKDILDYVTKRPNTLLVGKGKGVENIKALFG